MNICIASMASINICIKAQKALLSNGIGCRIVSLNPSLTRRGCAYGIEFTCSHERQVKQILRDAGVTFSQIIKNAEGRSI